MCEHKRLKCVDNVLSCMDCGAFLPLEALTADAGRMAYRLCRRPDDFAVLERALGGASVVWQDDSMALEVSGAPFSPEEMNARLLPILLDCGVVSVVAGRTLEETYLGFSSFGR